MPAKKLEKNIVYNPKTETYLVNNSFGRNYNVQSFSTLEDARNFRDAVNAEKLKLKKEVDIAKLREHYHKEVQKHMNEPQYPLNLLQDIFPSYSLFELARAIDFNFYVKPGRKLFEAIEYLNEREIMVVVGYYRDKKTLEALGNEIGVTKERVRQIVVKGLRKLKMQILKSERVLEGERKAQLQKEAIEEDFRDLQEKRKKFVEALDKWGLLNDEAKDMFMTETFKENELKRRHAEEITDNPIESYDLSVRSYNVLKRAGLTTKNKVVSYIKKTGEDWYMKLRNCGRKSKKEIEERFGVKNEQE